MVLNLRVPALLLLAGAALSGQGILDLQRSPHARLRDVPVSAVKMQAGFWADRMRVNAERSVPSMLQELEDHGIVNNFRRLSGRSPQATHQGPVYTDSDLYKWIEAAAFVLQSGDRPALRATVDKLIDDILAAQEPSGYLNTYYQGDKAALRFTEMHRSHELYCLGHLLQAAIAYYRATGDRKLLDGGIRFVDYLIANFGPGKRPLLTGHPELEMALVELYRTTGNRADLELAGYLLSGVERERLKLTDGQVTYMFSGKPFTSRTEVEGHAVRAMYAASGATDYYLETGDPAYWKTLNRLWDDLTSSKMYITGGVGSRASGEAFGVAYELPNQQAYGESCAAIANLMFNWRMLMATAESRYADVMERALYNGINSGMSLDGTTYCYRNPLESAGEKIRNPWYETTCCPPNLERTLAALPGYLYGVNEKGVYANLYHSSDMSWHLPGGAALQIAERTEYPWQGAVHFTVNPARAVETSVFLRIPGWSTTGNTVLVNGKPWSAAPVAGRYLEIHRTWQAGDRIDLTLDMRTRLMAANPLLREDAGRVAVERGPLVYCLESADQPAMPSLFDAALAGGADFELQFRPDVLGGLMELRHSGAVTAKSAASEPLYREWGARAPATRPVTLTFIPYYAWANRGPLPMEVWVPYQQAKAVR